MSVTAKCSYILSMLACTSVAVAASDVSDADCEKGVCVVNVFSPALKVPPCRNFSILAAFSQTSGATLIQCSKFDDPEEDKIVIYDRTGSQRVHYELSGGKFIRRDFLTTAAAEGIEGKFGPVPLCNRSISNSSKAELVVAEKEVASSSASPYCYRLYFISSRPRLRVTTDDGRAIPPAKATSFRKWTALEQALLPYLERRD